MSGLKAPIGDGRYIDSGWINVGGVGIERITVDATRSAFFGNEQNVRVLDGSFSLCSTNAGDDCGLWIEGLDESQLLAVPNDAEIMGVVVAAQIYQTAATAVQFESVHVRKASANWSANLTDGALDVPAAATYTTFGSKHHVDDMPEALAGADIKALDFGAYISCLNGSAVASFLLFDWFGMRFFYR